ncbi:MAG: MFS transporter [Trueperaceae bacterium]
MTQRANQSKMIERTPFYYGWMILISATVGLFLTMPGQTAGISVFLEQIIASLEIPRTTVSLLYLLGTLGGALTLTLIGRAIDLFGPRKAVAVIAVMFAGGCFLMSAATGPLMLLFGLTLIRAFGQGGLPLVSIHTVNLWFVRRRGLAVGVAGLGVALGTAVFPPLIELLMGAYGWRTAYALLGGLIVVTVLPLGLAFFREHPEHYGLLPDGGAPAEAVRREADEPSLTLGQARRTLTFWLYVLGGVSVSALGTGLVFHHYAIMEANGVERAAAAAMFVSFGLVMAASNLATGLAMDRVPPRYLLSLNLALLVTCLLTASSIGSPGLVVVYGIFIGGMQGMHSALQAGVYAHYFGRRHAGAVRGFATTIFVGGTAAGPYLFALGFDLMERQEATLWAWAALPVLVGAAAPFLKPVPRRHESD